MSEGESLDVKIRLLGDDNTAKMFDALAKRLEEVNKSIANIGATQKTTAARVTAGHEGGSITGGMLKADAIKAAASKAFHTVKDLYTEVKQAGIKSQEDLQGVIGTFVSKGSQANMAVIGGASKVVKDELEDIAMNAGLSSDQVQKAFEDIAQRSSRSVVEIENLVGSLSKISNFTRGGLPALTQGFAQLETGVVRAQNPIVQLIASTGVMKGNAHAVAQAMMKMSPAEQFKKGEEAVARMNRKLKDAPLTMAQLSQSMKGIKEQLMESIGEGLTGGGLTRKIHAWLMQHKDGIAAIAKYGVGAMTGANSEKDFKYQVDKHMGPKGTQFIEGLEAAAAHLKNFATGVKVAAEWALRLSPVGMAAQGAAWAVQGVQWLKNKATGGNTATGGATTEEMEKSALAQLDIAKGGGVLNTKGTGLSTVKSLMKTLKNDALAAGAGADAGAGLLDQMFGTDKKKRRPHTEEEIASSNVSNAYAKQMQDFNQIQGVAAAGNANEFVSMWQQAAANNDVGMKNMLAETLGGSEVLQDALFKSGLEVKGGFEALADFMTEGAGKVYKAALKKFADVKGGAAPFIGHATFNLKQDFRQQDSDAIAMIFREDVAKNALYRVQNSLSTPNGG